MLTWNVTVLNLTTGKKRVIKVKAYNITNVKFVASQRIRSGEHIIAITL